MLGLSVLDNPFQVVQSPVVLCWRALCSLLVSVHPSREGESPSPVTQTAFMLSLCCPQQAGGRSPPQKSSECSPCSRRGWQWEQLDGTACPALLSAATASEEFSVFFLRAQKNAARALLATRPRGANCPNRVPGGSRCVTPPLGNVRVLLGALHLHTSLQLCRLHKAIHRALPSPGQMQKGAGGFHGCPARLPAHPFCVSWLPGVDCVLANSFINSSNN